MIIWLENHKKVAITLTILMAIEIFYFSTLPGGIPSTRGNEWIPRAYHFIAFFLFTFFLFVSTKSNKKISAEQILWILLIASLYAVTDEIHQIFIPFRDCTPGDFLTDLAGIISAIILYLLTNKKD